MTRTKNLAWTALWAFAGAVLTIGCTTTTSGSGGVGSLGSALGGANGTGNGTSGANGNGGANGTSSANGTSNANGNGGGFSSGGNAAPSDPPEDGASAINRAILSLTCDPRSDLSACSNCIKTACCDVMRNCVEHYECISLSGCLVPCGKDETCRGQCATQDEEQVPNYLQITNCAVQFCQKEC